MKNTLRLPLKKQWYEMIESGIKTEEYREIKPYWTRRFIGMNQPLFSFRYGYQQANVKGYTHVKFSYGYTKRTMTFEIKEITIGKGKPEWGAPKEDVFIIKLGERICKCFNENLIVMAEEEKVKVVFEFNKDDYNKYLFLIDQEPDKDTEKAWEVMMKEGINLSTSSIAKNIGISQKEALAMFVALAVMEVKDKVK